jgi:hypothetical protein
MSLRLDRVKGMVAGLAASEAASSEKIIINNGLRKFEILATDT